MPRRGAPGLAERTWREFKAARRRPARRPNRRSSRRASAGDRHLPARRFRRGAQRDPGACRHDQLDLIEQAQERAELNLRSAKGFFEVGTARSRTRASQVDVANAKLDPIRAKNALRSAIVALNTAMAITVDTWTQIVDTSSTSPSRWTPAAPRRFARQRPSTRPKLGAAGRRAKRSEKPFATSCLTSRARGIWRTQRTQRDWSVGVFLELVLSSTEVDGSRGIRRPKAVLEGARANVKSTELTILQNVDRPKIASRRPRSGSRRRRRWSPRPGETSAGAGAVRCRRRHHSRLNGPPSSRCPGPEHREPGPGDYRIALARLDRAVGPPLRAGNRSEGWRRSKPVNADASCPVDRRSRCWPVGGPLGYLYNADRARPPSTRTECAGPQRGTPSRRGLRPPASPQPPWSSFSRQPRFPDRSKEAEGRLQLDRQEEPGQSPDRPDIFGRRLTRPRPIWNSSRAAVSE